MNLQLQQRRKQRARRRKLLLGAVGVAILLMIAVAIAFFPTTKKAAISAQQVQLLYRVTDAAASSDPILLVQQAVKSGADSLLWDAPLTDPEQVKAVSEQARSEGVGLVAVVESDMDSAQQAELIKQYGLSGLCAQPTDQNGLANYQPLTDQLQQIVQPDSLGVELYALWATGEQMAMVIADTDGTDQIALCSQFTESPKQTQTALVQAESLLIGLPESDLETTADQYFVAGTADPAQPLTVNGQTVTVEQGGFWGLAISLADGENVVTATQGETTASITITKTKPQEGSWEPVDPQPDDSQSLQQGQFIQVTSAVASLLEDYTDSDTILQTVYEGAIAQVEESVEYTSSGKLTHAYKVANGWIRAADCQPLQEAQTMQLTTDGFEQKDRHSIFRIAGGSPLVIAQRTDTSLSLFLSGSTLTGNWEQTGLVQTVQIEQQENGVLLTFTTEPNALWGWSVDYTETGSEIILKAPPVLQDSQTPLQGVTVLLDAGHGQDDLGALGVMGVNGPSEKDLNLAAAQAVQNRLEQLGATVVMSRTDDTFLTLAERNQLLRSVKPDIFISLHHNSIDLARDVNEVRGVECYYFYPSGITLAENLSNLLSSATGRGNRGAKYNYFYVTRSDICPAVLLEIGFTPNPAEYASCVSAENLAKTGYTVAQAIQNTLQGVVWTPEQ